MANRPTHRSFDREAEAAGFADTVNSVSAARSSAPAALPPREEAVPGLAALAEAEADSMSDFSLSQTSDLGQPAGSGGGSGRDVTEAGDTLPGGNVPVPLAFSSWERYELRESLGVGGMGVVYKAYDPRLSRFIAIKFRRGHKLSGALVEKFYREARAQARVEHDNVCKIYEVGEVDKVPYIAMQLINGQSLRTATKKGMTLEQRVDLTRQVALGLHAAHRQGLIHRDVKPANIMVERGSDDSLRAYVMDFGIAWETADVADSEQHIVGTPSYMSPEQARGDASSLDRRSDVYNLGATFYELLTDRPPHIAPTTSELLHTLQSELPRPVRQLNPRVPSDLEMVVMKCLEKEPEARYGSALAVAEELQRFLDGEPVRVAQTSFLYRLIKRAKKNRLIVAIMMVAALAAIIAIGIAIHTWRSSAKVAALAQQVGRDVERIENFMLYAYSLPQHDIAREQAVIRREIERLQGQRSQHGAIGDGVISYAIGRGHFALHEYDKAYQSLDLAVKQGYKTPDAKYAIGRALGELYKEALTEARKISETDVRQKRLQEIDHRYREPALANLQEAVVFQDGAPEYAQGLLAFYGAQYDDALIKAQQAEQREPWMYEAKKLQADVYSARGDDLRAQARYSEAMKSYKQAALLFRQAGETARSDSEIHEAEARQWSVIAEVGYLIGQVDESLLGRAMVACDRAIASDPRNGRAHERKAHILLRMSRAQLSRGEDVSEVASLGIEFAQQAARLMPKDVYPLAMQANFYVLLADGELRRGRDSLVLLGRAIKILREIIRVDPRWEQSYNMLSSTLSELGLTRAEQGADARPLFTEAITVAQQGIAINPRFNLTHVQLLLGHSRLAFYQSVYGGDPAPAAQAALDYKSDQLDALKNIYGTYQAFAQAQLAQALAALDSGSEPHAFIAAGLAQIEKSLKLNDRETETYVLKALAYRLSAAFAVEHAQDAMPLIAQGLAAVEQGLAINLAESSLYNEQAQLELLTAQQTHDGKTALAALDRAQAAAQRSIEQSRANSMAHVLLAESSRLRIERMPLAQAQRPAILDSGLSAAEQAVKLNPRLPQALAVRSQLLLERARLRGEKPAAGGDVQQAVLSLKEALRLNPRLVRRYGEALDAAQKPAVTKPAPEAVAPARSDHR